MFVLEGHLGALGRSAESDSVLRTKAQAPYSALWGHAAESDSASQHPPVKDIR